MTLPKGYPDDMRVILVRRGENMRVVLPVDPMALNGIMPPELALEAAKAILSIQEMQPGRADMPIIVGDTPFGLAHRGSDYVLDPKMNVGFQLDGHWEDTEIELIDLETRQVVMATVPCVVLNLDDIERL